MNDNFELHAIFYGRVQGVGFRWTIVDCAQKCHLVGTTKNLSNGSVEVFAQGSQDALESFLKAITSDPGLARIESITKEYSKPKMHYQNFKIVY